eukprot:gnl/TRDRNA2_/TRDRNA2_193664_c0_seq1.p1 gnl/TRDRNA2_/TRDRNA2_193664_c0~~gnl/TRDRNA2_/TRDRNA2_193664_c0_seq1.p1  ORF type:complete len:142 (+),score=29.06 gnl/TRDRNA2_/TRDRNA2_193664_c0_seq1:70-495(+)
MADDPMTGVPPSAAVSEDELRQRVARAEGLVDDLLRRDHPAQALAEALRDPPYAATTAETKDRAAQLVLKALGAFKEAGIRSAVAALGEEEQFALMKYLYRFWGAGLAARTNAQLFIWHAALVEQSGEATIVRAIYDWRWP